MSNASCSFFESNGEGSDDPLCEMAMVNPEKALKFIKMALSFGTTGNGVVCFIEGLFLLLSWSECDSCDRPLRWWLLGHSVMQAFQVAIRQKFSRDLRASEAAGRASVQSCIVSLATMPAWRASKVVSLATYGWLVLGSIWSINSGSCCQCLYGMTVAVIVQASVRVLILVTSFNVITSDIAGEATPDKVCAALPEEIASLAVSCFSATLLPSTTDEEGMQSGSCVTCAICLSDYRDREVLCHLPCGHQFHMKCADNWLGRNKKCPLCMREIDAVCCRSPISQCLRRMKVKTR